MYQIAAFENEAKGKEACHAIAALCEVCAIDSLISNFILPLHVIYASIQQWFLAMYLIFVEYWFQVICPHRSVY